MAKFSEIRRFLEGKGIEFRVVKLQARAISVEDVLRNSGGDVLEEEIIKTLVVKDKSGRFVGYVLRGWDRLNSAIFDRLATKDEVLQIAGVPIGAVCPILLGIPIKLDRKVKELKRINMGSGDLLKGMEINLKDLLKVLPDYTIEEIT